MSRQRYYVDHHASPVSNAYKLNSTKNNADIRYFAYFIFRQTENLKQSRIEHFLQQRKPPLGGSNPAKRSTPCLVAL